MARQTETTKLTKYRDTMCLLLPSSIFPSSCKGVRNSILQHAFPTTRAYTYSEEVSAVHLYRAVVVVPGLSQQYHQHDKNIPQYMVALLQYIRLLCSSDFAPGIGVCMAMRSVRNTPPAFGQLVFISLGCFDSEVGLSAEQ